MPAADFATQTGPAPRSARGRDPRLRPKRSTPRRPGTGACGPPGEDSLCARRHPGSEPQRGVAVLPHVDAVDRSTIARSRRPSARRRALAAARPLARGRVTTAASPSRCARTPRSGTFSTSPRRAVDDHADADRLARRRDASTTATRAPGRAHADGVGDRGTTPARTTMIGRGRTGRAARGDTRVGARSVRAGDCGSHAPPRRTRSETRRPPACAGASRRRRSARFVATPAAACGRSLPDGSLGAGTVTATSGTAPRRPRGGLGPPGDAPHRGRWRSGRHRSRRDRAVATVDGARRPVSRAALRLVVRAGRCGASSRGRAATGAAGKARLRVPRGPGCFTVTVTRASAQGFAWNGKTPRNRFCRRLSRRRRGGRRATPSASRARSRGAGSRSCPRRSA